jgi:hypothetical protein
LTVYATTTTYNTSRSTTTVYSTAASYTAFDSTSASSFNFVCDEFLASTYYGSNVVSGLPQINSFVYTNSSGTSALANGYYGATNAGGFSPSHYFRTSGGAGGVIDLQACSGGFSDIKLKTNIKFLYRSASGLNVYSFEYIDKRFGAGKYEGVMAHEVDHIEGAVIPFSNGLRWVNYDKIDVEFKEI